MADGFHIVLRGIREVEAEMKRIDRNVNRATMWTVREAGRRTKQVAKRAAPRKTGALRGSIHSSKRLTRDGEGGYRVGVAPRGAKVHLYSQKIEAKYGYMAAGQHAVDGEMRAIAERAWVRATRGRR